MKNLWIGSSLLPIILGTMLAGCSGGGNDSSSQETQQVTSTTKSAFLSDSRIAGITYKCGTLIGLTDTDGKFSYSSSECSIVNFTIGGVSLGSLKVADIKEDAIFYPSDILGLDRNNTSDPKLVGMLQFLQSLDSDNNPNNGINIDANTTTNLQSVTLNLDENTTTIDDINSSVNGLNKSLINADYAVAHYEDTLRSDLNITVDTVAPAPVIIVSMPTETYTDTTLIVINGEKGAKVFVNGVDTNVTINHNNSAELTLNTINSIGDDINITSSITLKDDVNLTSDITDATIFRPGIETLDQRDLEQMKTNFALSNTPRIFSYTPRYITPNDVNITFSETPRAATTEDQNYSVTATLSKGVTSDTISFDENIPFSQELRDLEEVQAIKRAITSRVFSYTQKWATGEDYNVTFSEPMRAAIVETQDYNVTATITKGSATTTSVFTESVPFSQTLRDIAEVNAIKTGLASANNPRTFSHTPLWNTGSPYSISFSIPAKNATTEDQTYNVTATITKGSATDTSIFTETIPFSQTLRDIAEVNAIKTGLASANNPRTFSHTPLWNSGAPYSISFSEPVRVATAIDQTYNVTATIAKGTQTDTYVFSEFVPTTNVNIELGDGTTTLINDKYKDIYTVTNGGIFQKVGSEDKFIGTSISVDTTTLPSTISSSNDLLNYIVNNSGISLSSISSKESLDGSLVARYEINNQNTSLYANLESLLASLNYSITNLDLSQYANIANVYVDFYIEYDSSNNSYAIVVLTDKTSDFDNDIVKIANKDSIIETSETIVNETETFTITNTIKKGDFIFVIDDSGSMGSSQASTIDAIEQTFSTYTAKYDLDWKATVLGTEAGWDYSSFASSYVENNITALSNKLDELTTDGGDERGLKIAYKYLNDSSITQRANSSTTIIYASDEVEHSTLNEFGETDTDFTNSYFALNNIRFNSIIPTSFNANSEQAAKMALSTGGERVDIYNYASGYDRMMDLAIRHAAAESSPIKLAYPALASSITVSVDGVREDNWEYDENANSTTIVFDAAHTPAAGSEVVVTYSHLDYTQIIADAKTAFDALDASQKRAYTNSDIDVTFNPASPLVPLADQDQTYDVTVTFSKLGYSDTTTFSETVAAADFYTQSNSGWSDNNGAYVSQSITSDSTSSLEVVSLVDNVMYIDLNDNTYDRLKVYKNGVQEYDYDIYNQNENLELNTSAGDIIKLEHYKYYASSVSDANTTLQIYTPQELANLLPSVKANFDALTSHQRDYTDKFVSLEFDPIQVKTPLQNVDQAYDVNVTFSYNGNTLTSTYTETVPKFDYVTINSNTDWLQNGVSFESQNHTNSSTSTLELTIQKDTTINYAVSSEGSYDKLRITVNGTVIGDFGNTSGTVDFHANDTVTLEYHKDGSTSSGTDNAIVTFQ